ncbi:NADH:flavin oxidoreductase/NADH oxidase [uncultured Mucilaginibacter sp.]|uniref:NADH:flavin oxidoreductase/NADH oxidase n=1 Tax=uncultured Mucilaginibacter sp. TaxID=797541 RepID=UPI0025FD142E|nr:NADH:flavin oxidoreductase/NADH oxidase [uncultured Mucilaginibacter sp.]
MSNLFSPLTIKGIELKNRIAVSPMCQYSSMDGFANPWHTVHLGSFAVGGAALVMTEATAVSPEGRITASDLGIWKDEHIDQLKQITTFIEKQGAIPGIQLAHAGRKGSHSEPWNGGTQVPVSAEGGWLTVAPSAIPFKEETEAPEALDAAGISKLTGNFEQATLRALKAGFKVIEIHAAHGYLLHEFLSPLSNHRTDEYGGTFENRIRLLLQITDAVRSVLPDENPLFVRISATDWTEGGWDAEQAIKLSAILKQHGVDLVDCSSGGNVPHAKIPVGPGYQVQFAESIRKETGVLTGAVGMITEPQQADDIIKNGKADIVSLARELLRDPHFPLRAAHALGVDIKWPLQYERAKWS